jgi:hypothetical protein
MSLFCFILLTDAYFKISTLPNTSSMSSVSVKIFVLYSCCTFYAFFASCRRLINGHGVSLKVELFSNQVPTNQDICLYGSIFDHNVNCKIMLLIRFNRINRSSFCFIRRVSFAKILSAILSVYSKTFKLRCGVCMLFLVFLGCTLI